MSGNHRNNKAAPFVFERGKIPPQAPDLEEAVLGAVMLEKKAVDIAYPFLDSDFFYKDANRLVWDAIAAIYTQRGKIDILTVTEKARELGTLEGMGGAYYITTLTNRIASAAHVEYHCLLIIQKWIARELIKVCGTYYHSFYDDSGDVFEKMDRLIMEMNRIQKVKLRNKGNKSWAKILDETMNDIEQAMNKSSMITGIPTGDRLLNEMTGGWQKGDMIVLAGRPSMGKTAFALHLMMVAVQAGFKVKFYSLEMSYRSLAMRILSADSEIEFKRLKRGQITPDELMHLRQVEQNLKHLNISINDNGRMTVFDISADARLVQLTDGLDMIIVDYLGLIDSPKVPGQSREQQVSEISRELKHIAKELDIPNIALSQLNRVNESQTEKRPQLSNLRDSGSVEQDADMVGFVFRPVYYTKGDMAKESVNDYHNLSEEEYKRVFEFIIEKNRNGTTGTVVMDWDGSRQKFVSVN